VARDFLTLALEDLLDQFARETRVPGAGPGAALVTAVAAALVAMVARFSRDSWAEAGTTVAQAEALRRRVLNLAREDADALEAFLAARDTSVEPRAEARDFQLGRTLDRAAEVPLAIAEAACDVALLAAHAAERGDGEVRADAVTAALLAHGAARAAAHLVEVNLTSAVDDDRVRRVQDLVRTAGAAAEQAIAPAA
jgi:glutamate formiminotransferase/formiminotetrahydrofolate cyclodeaminase